MLAGKGELAHGVVTTVDLPAVSARFRPRLANVYLPPAWFRRDHPRLPVVLLLAGTPGHTTDWTRAGNADRAADRYAQAHHGIGPILVMADGNGSFWGDTECVDLPGREAETYLTVDVPAAMRRVFDTGPDPWAIMGSSEGGTCAVTLALRHPDRFGVFADLSGEYGPTLGQHRTTVAKLFGGSEERWRASDPRTLLSNWHHGDAMAGWFEVGNSDHDPRKAAAVLHGLARDAGLNTHLVMRAGAHNFIFWSDAFDHALAWVLDRLRPTVGT